MTDVHEDYGDTPWRLMGALFQAHPWHGIAIGSRAPDVVTVYVEMTPSDTVKYEVDKVTGHLKVDRPQKYSSLCPSLYGFIPQTYCGEQVADLTIQRTNRSEIVGDGDPLDICVLAERTIIHGGFTLRALPIGGFRMIDGDEADDKIIAVLVNDPAYGTFTDISQCPAGLLDRLEHYFLTYKQVPGAASQICEITHTYGAEEARDVIQRSRTDYLRHFGDIATVFDAAQEQRKRWGINGS